MQLLLTLLLTPAAAAAGTPLNLDRMRELVEEVRAMPAEPPAPFIKPDLSSLPALEPAGSLSQLAAKRFRVSRKPHMLLGTQFRTYLD
jgi:hypothetical protein